MVRLIRKRSANSKDRHTRLVPANEILNLAHHQPALNCNFVTRGRRLRRPSTPTETLSALVRQPESSPIAPTADGARSDRVDCSAKRRPAPKAASRARRRSRGSGLYQQPRSIAGSGINRIRLSHLSQHGARQALEALSTIDATADARHPSCTTSPMRMAQMVGTPAPRQPRLALPTAGISPNRAASSTTRAVATGRSTSLGPRRPECENAAGP